MSIIALPGIGMASYSNCSPAADKIKIKVTTGDSIQLTHICGRELWKCRYQNFTKRSFGGQRCSPILKPHLIEKSSGHEEKKTVPLPGGARTRETLAVYLLALPQHQHTSFLCPDVSDRIALSFFTELLFKSSLKKDRAILSETSGQRKLVCWCWGRAKRLTWPSKNPKNHWQCTSHRLCNSLTAAVNLNMDNEWMAVAVNWKTLTWADRRTARRRDGEKIT